MKNSGIYGKRENLALGLWVKLARSASIFGKLTEENIRTFGLTGPQFAVLECLGHLGPLKLSALSKKMLVSGGNITCVVDNLEKENLVERISVKEDRRVLLVRLTKKGKELFENIFRRHAEHVANLASVLNEKEQQSLSHFLKKLGCSLQEFHTDRKGKIKI